MNLIMPYSFRQNKNGKINLTDTKRSKLFQIEIKSNKKGKPKNRLGKQKTG